MTVSLTITLISVILIIALGAAWAYTAKTSRERYEQELSARERTISDMTASLAGKDAELIRKESEVETAKALRESEREQHEKALKEVKEAHEKALADLQAGQEKAIDAAKTALALENAAAGGVKLPP